MVNWLTPAVVFMDRFSYSLKFFWLGTLAIVPALFPLFTALPPLYEQEQMSQGESVGIGYVEEAVRLFIALQRHRGLSSAALSGDNQSRGKLAGEAEQIHQAIQRLNDLDGETGYRAIPSSGLAKLEQSWGQLHQSPPGVRAENFAAHTRLVEQAMGLISDLADYFQLTLDPVLTSYYLQDLIVYQAPPLMEALGKMRGKTAGILARGNVTDDERIAVAVLTDQSRSQLSKVKDNLRKAINSEPSLRLSLEPLIATLDKSVVDATDLTLKQLTPGGMNLSGDVYFQRATQPINDAVTLLHQVAPQLRVLLQKRYAQHRLLLLTNLTLSIGMLLLLGYGVLGMRYAMLRAVTELGTGSATMAKGDLSRPIHVGSQDEMGEISRDLEGVRTALANIIGAAHQVAESVAQAAGQVEQRTTLIAQASHHQNSSISAAAASVEEMTMSVSQIAARAGETDHQANVAGKLAEDGRRVAETASQEMAQVASSFTEAARQIEGLSSKTELITGIVQVIRAIAEQTNLLALNAAIEAARAGEQGRGFAVVADEVRNLAERTGKATAEISNTIALVQTETRSAVTSMESSSRRAVEGERTVSATAQALDRIHQAVEQALVGVGEIAQTSREQHLASQEIARNVETVARMTAENTQAADELSRAASHLGTLAEGLHSSLSTFRT